MEKFETLLEELHSVTEKINVDRVFGAAETVGERVIIPVAALSYGFGFGGGPVAEADAPAPGEVGVGGGGGASARPLAYIEIGPEGTRVAPILDEQKVALAGILLGAWTVGWLGLVLKTVFRRRA